MIRLHPRRRHQGDAAAHHPGVEFEPRIVDLTKGEQQKPEFVALNPNRETPVLETEIGRWYGALSALPAWKKALPS